MPPVIVWAVGVVGAAYVVKAAKKEWRRVNDELDRVKAQAVRDPDRATLPTLRRDPSGVYRL
jgi:hypothetical protein